MIRDDLRAAMNLRQEFTATELAKATSTAAPGEYQRYAQNACVMLNEMAKKGSVVFVRKDGLNKVYRWRYAGGAAPTPTAEPDPTTKAKPVNIQERWQQETVAPLTTFSGALQDPNRHGLLSPTQKKERLAAAERREAKPEPTTDLTDVQIGRAMINFVAQLEQILTAQKATIERMGSAARLAAAEHHRQLDAKEQALRAAQDTIRQLEHKLQQATLIRRPIGSAPLTMAIGKLLDSAGAGR